MKKTILTLVVALVAAFSANAFDMGKMSIGAEYNYASKGGLSGFGVQMQYQLPIAHLRVAPEFNYFFGKKEHADRFNVNVNLHYMINSGSGFDLYPLAGISYANLGKDVNRLGANVGCGAEYNITGQIGIFCEERLQLMKDCTQFVTAIGVKYSF